MAAKIFIDGEAGTTGLQIRERLAERRDLELLSIPTESRKDNAVRAALLNEADIAILCLPDDAAKESVSLIENDRTKVIDASTAHRVAEAGRRSGPHRGRDRRRTGAGAVDRSAHRRARPRRGERAGRRPGLRLGAVRHR